MAGPTVTFLNKTFPCRIGIGRFLMTLRRRVIIEGILVISTDFDRIGFNGFLFKATVLLIVYLYLVLDGFIRKEKGLIPFQQLQINYRGFVTNGYAQFFGFF